MPHRTPPRRLFFSGIALLVIYVIAYLAGLQGVAQQAPPVILPLWFATVASMVTQLCLTFGALLIVVGWATDYVLDALEIDDRH